MTLITIKNTRGASCSTQHPPRPPSIPLDRGWTAPNRVLLTVHSRSGSPSPLSPSPRHNGSPLPPFPSLCPPCAAQETWEMQYEKLVEQFAIDMNIYMRSVCDTINITVPK